MSEKAKGRLCLRMEVFCRLWLLLLFLCLCDLCHGQRQVQIQAGPLYRVEGYPISISCNVTGFKGSPEQDFEFFNKKSNMDINIISTKDPDYAYAKYSSRVNNKEILIEKLSGSKALLKINTLQMEDAGELFCHTPNTDGVYWGNYEDGTTLNVIKDTLVASYSGSPSQSLLEGDPLQLECQASSETFQHTHLSVTWFVQGEKDENPRPIITLDKDLNVKTGAAFEDRYHAGFISMDKVEDTTYRLKMAQVRQSDQGKFYCKATELIQDPDRSWTQIAHKTTTACNVEIKSIEKKLHVHKGDQSLNITNMQAGFSIDCVIKSRSSDKSILEVTWLKVQEGAVSIPIFTARRDGTLHSDVSDRYLVFGRPEATHYKLTVPQMNPSDEGKYYCQVKEWLQTGGNSWRELASDQSGELSVHVHIEEMQSSNQADPFRMTLAITIPLIIFLVLVIILLVRREHKRNAS